MSEHRSLEFATVDDAVEAAETLLNVPTRTTGSFSHAEIIRHLALTLDLITGHEAGPKFPWFIRIAGPWIKNGTLKKPIKPGFNLPRAAQSYFWPDTDVDLETAMKHLRQAYARYAGSSTLPRHPIFGKMTREEHDTLQRRHFSLHLGFVHPS